MNVEHVNSFYKATQDVFELMLDLGVDRGKLKVTDGMVSGKETNVTLGVTGDLRGSIVFGFPKEMTLEMVKIMSGMEVKEIDHFVSSALGEVANIIGGNALTNLSSKDIICDIVPPQIYIGDYKSISMANEKSLQLPLKTEIGEFNISIFLSEK